MRSKAAGWSVRDFAKLDGSGVVVHRTIVADPDPVPWTRPARPARRGGRLLVRFGLGGRPAQWVTHGTNGTKAEQRRALRAWQDRVSSAAALAMRTAGATLAAGLVEVWIDFVFLPDSRLPDRDNLVKGTTDALEGVCFLNDAQVIGGEGRRLIGGTEGIVVEVWAVAALVLP